MSRDIKAGGAYVELLLRNEKFVAGLRSASARLKNFGDAAKRVGSLGFLGGGGGGGIAGLFAGAGAAAALAYPIKLAANLEVAQAQFTAFTGSADKADAMLTRLEKFAAKSLLPVEELQRATQLLLSYEVAADDAIPAIEALAAISRGSAERFQLLSLATGQVVGKTRLYAAEVRQLSESGFNPLKTIMKQSGEEYEQVSKRLEAGGISANEFMAALRAAVGPTGQFAGLLDAMSKTAMGAFSRLLTGVKLAIRPLGQELLPAIRGVLETANEWVPAFAKIVKENAKIATVVGLAVVSFVGAAAAITSFGIAVQVAGFGLAGVAAALGLLLNPITLVTGAVAGLGYWFATSTEWGRTMVASLAGWFGQLREIAVEAFGGIADALAAGDIVLAWKVTTLGIQSAWLQATNGLRETWATFRQAFVQSTLDMLYAAQSHWATFVNSIQSLLASVATESRSFGERVGHALTRSSDPGLARDQDAAHDNAMNRIAQEGAAEQQRIANKKGAELAAIDEQRRAAKEIAEGAFFGEMDRINKDLAKAKEDLAVARSNAKAAWIKAGAAAAGGAPAFDPANFNLNLASLKNDIFGSFSGAALAAQGGAGGNVQNKILDEIKTGNKAQEKLGAKQLAAIKDAGVIGP